MAYKTSFSSFEEACSINGMSKEEMLTRLRAKLENDNYRANYMKSHHVTAAGVRSLEAKIHELESKLKGKAS